MTHNSETTAFDDKQYEDAYPTGIADHYWHLARTDIIAESLVRYAPKETAILEVGCGRGIVVNSLRSRGFNIIGAELADVRAIEEAVPFVSTSIDANKLPVSVRESIQVILLLDVIEHISDPVFFLNEIRNSFPNLLHVVVTVPARAELWSNFDEYFGHYLRYDQASVKAMVAELGGKILTIRYFFHTLYFLAFFAKRLGFEREISFSAPSNRRQRVVNRMIAGILKLEYKLSFGRLPGTSLLLAFKW